MVDGECFKETRTVSDVTLTFYQDTAKTKEGLQKTSQNRTLHVIVVTKNNQEWVKNAQEDWQHTHTNKVEAGTSEIHVTDEDSESIYSKAMKKKGESLYQNGHHLIKYSITLFGLNSDSISIEDTFDTTILHHVNRDDLNTYGKGYEVYDNNADTITGTGNNVNKQSNLVVTSTGTGIRISCDNVPKQDGGAYFGGYNIVYYLEVDDEKLNQIAFPNADHKAVIKNSASWDGISAESNIDYTYHPLEKTQGQYNADTNTIPYTITLNKGKVQMNAGNAMTLTDTSMNLYIDPKDISVTTDPAAKKSEVKYDIADNTLKFTIPDETAVTITYYGYVLGETGKQINVSNTASLLGETVKTDLTPTKVASGGGEGTVCKVYIKKYEAGDYNHQLPGAEFNLLDSDKNPIKYGSSSSNSGKDVTFTTGRDGLAEVYLSSETDGVSLKYDTQYYLKETKAPDGYECSDQLIPFQISKTENNPQNHIYFGSSNINISNPKIVKVKITLHKQKKGDSTVNLAGAVFSLYRAATDGNYSNSNELLLAQNLTTGSDGTVVLQGKDSTQELVSGTYYLVETSAPAGYEFLPSPVKLVVSNGKVTVGNQEYTYSADSSGTNTCTINIEDTPKKQFVFYKRWENADQVITWPNDVNQINVTLHGTFSSTDSTVNGKTKDYPLTLNTTGGQRTVSEGSVCWNVESSDNSYKYTVTNLPATIYTDEQGVNHVGAWTYSVTETKLDGYDTFYGQYVANTESGTAQIVIDDTKKSAGDGEYIVNKQSDRYTLPSTGGPGTGNITVMGAILLALGAFLMVRKLLMIRSDGEGGGSL